MGTSAMASDRVGVAANTKAVAPLADYFHCAMHGLNYQQDATKPVFNHYFCNRAGHAF